MSFKELYQEYVNETKQQRIEKASGALRELYDILAAKGLSKEQQADFVWDVVKLFVSADKKCSNVELELFNQITGLSLDYDTFFASTNRGANYDFVAKMDELIDTLGGDGKLDVCVIGLCFMAADGTLTVEEQNLFERILG